jgi:hypothetical protein
MQQRASACGFSRSRGRKSPNAHTARPLYTYADRAADAGTTGASANSRIRGCDGACVGSELIRNGRVPTPGIGIVAASEVIATRLGVEGVVVVLAR